MSGRSHRKCPICLDWSLEAESCCVDAPRDWVCQCVPTPAVTHANELRAELVDAHRLFAKLVWHQVRPRNRFAADRRQRLGSSHDSKPGPVLVVAAGVGSLCPLESARPMATAPAASPASFPAPIETLFTQLARRRLRFAAKERP